jgi:hypothetical protein
MSKAIVGSKIFTVLLSAAALMMPASQALAWGRGGDDDHHGRDDDHSRDFHSRHYVELGHGMRRLPDDYVRLVAGGVEFFFWEGMFFRPVSGQYVAVAAPVGAVVPVVPQGCAPLIVDGVTYYTINGITYMYTSTGYQVVPPPRVVVVNPAPVVVVQPAPIPPPPQRIESVASQTAPVAADDMFTVNLPNSKGGYTAVALKRSGYGYIGPQGEYYPEFPRVEQLKAMYAK